MGNHHDICIDGNYYECNNDKFSYKRGQAFCGGRRIFPIESDALITIKIARSGIKFAVPNTIEVKSDDF